MKRSIFKLLLAVVILGLISSASEAAYVTVNSLVGWSCTTGNGGFESGCTPDVERGTLSFTYNDQAVDTSINPDVGLFSNAITNFEMRVAQQTRPDLLFTLSGPSLIEFGGGISTETWLRMTIDTFDASGSLGYGTFVLNFASQRIFDHTHLPPVDFWSYIMVNPGYGYGASETDWGYDFHAFSQQAAGDVNVPEPNSLLLIIGVVALLALQRTRTVFQAFRLLEGYLPILGRVCI